MHRFASGLPAADGSRTVGPPRPLGQVAGPAAVTPQEPSRVLSSPSPSSGADSSASRFRPCNTPPASTQFRDRNAPARRQLAGADAVTRPQRYPYDPALRAGQPAGLAARIPSGPSECNPSASSAHARTSQRYPERQSSRHPSGIGGNTSSSGNVSPPAERSENPS